MCLFKKTTLSAFAILLAVALLGGCAQQSSAPAASPAPETTALKMAPVAQLDPMLQSLPAYGRDAYRLALANEATFAQIPCYCGCGGQHDSVRACFVSAVQPNGTVSWDYHGSGCGICQDIVHDTAAMLQQGASLKEARAFIDRSYSKYAPPTNTPPIP